jgi:hypothetical protein
MATHTGNSKVHGGYYLSTSSFGIEVIGEAGGTLPGPATRKYVAVPFPALFLVVPVVGLAFLMFLPLIGFGLLAQALYYKVTGHVAEGASALAATMVPDQATGAAYLTGQKGAEPGAEKPAAPPSPELEQLERELKDRRS